MIKPALRYNPEWLIISESRGKESFDMINAATTGHNIVTTLHASSAKDVPIRLLNMCTEKSTNINEKTLLKNILKHGKKKKLFLKTRQLLPKEFNLPIKIFQK